MGVHHQNIAKDLMRAAVSMTHDAKADFWLREYGNHWTGAAVAKPTGASSCGGYDEACRAIEDAIDEMRDDILNRAVALVASRLEAAKDIAAIAISIGDK